MLNYTYRYRSSLCRGLARNVCETCMCTMWSTQVYACMQTHTHTHTQHIYPQSVIAVSFSLDFSSHHLLGISKLMARLMYLLPFIYECHSFGRKHLQSTHILSSDREHRHSCTHERNFWGRPKCKTEWKHLSALFVYYPLTYGKQVKKKYVVLPLRLMSLMDIVYVQRTYLRNEEAIVYGYAIHSRKNVKI